MAHRQCGKTRPNAERAGEGTANHTGERRLDLKPLTLDGVSKVVAALRAGIGTVGMSSGDGALLPCTGVRCRAAASKSSRGLLICTNIGHSGYEFLNTWLPYDLGVFLGGQQLGLIIVELNLENPPSP